MIPLLILMLFVGVAGATDAEDATISFEATGDRMAHFYLAPSPEAFLAIERGIKANLDVFQSQKNGASSLAIVFLAQVHEKYGYPLIDIGDFDDIAISLATRHGNSISRYGYDDSQIETAQLDVWWVSFFATGDTTYLDMIFALVGNPESQAGATNILVTGAANWSVTSNCRQHPVVLDHLKSVLARKPPVPNAEALRAIVSKLEGRDG